MLSNRITHQNSFDFLRLLAAFLVFHSHHYALSGLPEQILPWIGTTISGIGVSTFFVISGYLVSRSADRSISPTTFFTNRALRIMPGLTVNVVFMVLLGAIITSIPVYDYVTSKEVFDFLFRNILIAFNEPSYFLPGVFEQNPHTGVNGSLWTLPYEIGLYFVLFVVFYSIRDKSLRTVVVLLLTTVAGSLVISRDFFPDFNPAFQTWNWFLVKPLAVNGFCFCIGSLFHLTSETAKIKLLPKIIAISTLFSFGLTSTLSAYILLCYVVLLLGESRILILPKKIGDISYGFYLYAFPLQQAVIQISDPDLFYLNYTTSFLITVAFAFISWRYVEKPSLTLKGLISRKNTAPSLLPVP